MSELLPCPFCGGEAQFNIYETTCGVECEKCRIGTAFVLIDDYKQAIQAWNTRTERTCHMETAEGCQNWMSCSECGADYYNDQPLNYCPSCGAKVVSE